MSVYAVLAAFDARDAGLATLVLVSISVAQTLPVVPGNLGVFQAAAAWSCCNSSSRLPSRSPAPPVTAREGDGLGHLWREARRLRAR